MGGEIPPSFLLLKHCKHIAKTLQNIAKKYWQNIGNIYKIEVKTVIKRAEKGEKTRKNTNILGIFKIPPSPPYDRIRAERLLFLSLFRSFGPFSEHLKKEYWQNIGKMLK